MEDERYGTFCVDIARFYCGSREIWADFLRFVCAGVDGLYFFKILGNCGIKRRIIAKQKQEQGHGHEGRTVRYVVC